MQLILEVWGYSVRRVPKYIMYTVMKYHGSSFYILDYLYREVPSLSDIAKKKSMVWGKSAITSAIWCLLVFTFDVPREFVSLVPHFYTPHFNEVERGVYWFHLVRPSVRLSVCGQNRVSALYLQQYSSNPFHICTSYQATSEGVSRVKFVSKLKNL